MRYDVIIAGGGPIGGFIAGKLSEAGHSVLILEEHRKAGLPVQCAGLVTTKLEDIIDIRNCIVNTVHGAQIHAPSGHMLELDSGKPKAHVIDRAKFDQQILSGAVDHGAELRLNTRVTGVQRVKSNGHDEIKLTAKSPDDPPVDLQTGLLIGADGANSLIRELFGFPQPKIKLKGFGTELAYEDFQQKFVKIFSGNNIAPGFFAWVIPAGSTVRIGLCIMEGSGSTQDYFNRFYKLCLRKKLVPETKPTRTISGRIPLGALSQTTMDNVMLVGDAAAQVKPTSGGGIYPGLNCAVICSKIAAEALESSSFGNDKLQQYHRQWHKSIGNELDKGFGLHKAFLHLSDDKIEEAFNILDKPEILEVISRKGDIESPFKLAKLLFKKAPKLIKFAGPYFRSKFY